MSKGIRADLEKKLREETKRKIKNFLELKGRATFSELFQELGISKPTLTKCIKELEIEGDIRWYRNPEDRRSGYYELTEKAKKSDYFRQKAIAIYHYTAINKHIHDFDKFIEEAQKEGMDEENAKKMWLSRFYEKIGFGFANLSRLAIERDMSVALATFSFLVANELYELFPKIGGKVEEIFRKIPDNMQEVEKALSSIPEEDRERVKDIAFSVESLFSV
jgi:DNA-binding MarR family transcriptional regulator